MKSLNMGKRISPGSLESIGFFDPAIKYIFSYLDNNILKEENTKQFVTINGIRIVWDYHLKNMSSGIDLYITKHAEMNSHAKKYSDLSKKWHGNIKLLSFIFDFYSNKMSWISHSEFTPPRMVSYSIEKNQWMTKAFEEISNAL